MSTIAKLILCLIIVSAITIIIFGSVIHIMIPSERKENWRKTVLYVLFLLYLTFIAVLLFTPSFRILPETWEIPFVRYVQKTTNFVPFKTVRLFINGNKKGIISKWILWANIIGNILLLMPLAVFLPHKFKSQRKFPHFLLTSIIIISGIECLQLLFRVGYCDIDDFILNLTGMILVFAAQKLFFAVKKARLKNRNGC